MSKTGKSGKERGRNPDNAACRKEAHQELDQLINMAEYRQQYGSVTVEVGIKAGVIDLVRGKMDRSTKPAGT